MAFQLTGFQRTAFQIKDLQKVGGGGAVVHGYDRASHIAKMARERLEREDAEIIAIIKAFIGLL
jgi:hypothetical protein